MFVIMKAFCESPNGCQLEYLNFECTMENGSGDVEMKNLLAKTFVLLLSPSTKLRELVLSENKLGDNFVKVFVIGLKHNMRLEKLYLNGNDITSVGAMALATVLYYNRSLRYLSLSDNSIGDDGMIAISTALRYHPSIQGLSLSDNDMAVNDMTVNEIRTLTHLNSSQNSVGNVGTIVKALCEGPNDCRLENLNLDSSMKMDSYKVEMKKRLAEKFVLI
jgi:Ran GTPase-activating protein (RanGAP) involved in mRNA processing and transport